MVFSAPGEVAGGRGHQWVVLDPVNKRSLWGRGEVVSNRLMTSPGFDSNAHQLASLLQPLGTRLVWLLAEG